MVRYGSSTTPSTDEDWKQYLTEIMCTGGSQTGSGAGNRIPVYMAVGNHEIYRSGAGYDGGLTTSMARYKAVCDNPGNGSTNANRQERYYAFWYGPCRFIFLDANNTSDDALDNHDYLADGTTPDWEPGSEQYRWMTNQLDYAQRNAALTFVCFHPASYSRGSHGDPSDHQRGIELRALDPVFRQYGVDGVMVSHDHMVERCVTGPTGYHTEYSGGLSNVLTWRDEDNLNYFTQGNSGHSSRMADSGWETWMDITGNDAAPFYTAYFYDWAGNDAYASFTDVDIAWISSNRKWRAAFKVVRTDAAGNTSTHDEFWFERSDPLGPADFVVVNPSVKTATPGSSVYYSDNNLTAAGNFLVGAIDYGPLEISSTDGSIVNSFNNGAEGAKSACQIGSYIFFTADGGPLNGVKRLDAGTWSNPTAYVDPTNAAGAVSGCESICTDGTLLFGNSDFAQTDIHAWVINNSADSFTATRQWTVSLPGGRIRAFSYANGYLYACANGSGGSANRGIYAVRVSDQTVTYMGVDVPGTGRGYGTIRSGNLLMSLTRNNVYVWDLANDVTAGPSMRLGYSNADLADGQLMYSLSHANGKLLVGRAGLGISLFGAGPEGTFFEFPWEFAYGRIIGPSGIGVSAGNTVTCDRNDASKLWVTHGKSGSQLDIYRYDLTPYNADGTATATLLGQLLPRANHWMKSTAPYIGTSQTYLYVSAEEGGTGTDGAIHRAQVTGTCAQGLTVADLTGKRVGGGAFDPEGIAVDQANGYVYVSSDDTSGIPGNGQTLQQYTINAANGSLTAGNSVTGGEDGNGNKCWVDQSNGDVYWITGKNTNTVVMKVTVDGSGNFTSTNNALRGPAQLNAGDECQGVAVYDGVMYLVGEEDALYAFTTNIVAPINATVTHTKLGQMALSGSLQGWSSATNTFADLEIASDGALLITTRSGVGTADQGVWYVPMPPLTFTPSSVGTLLKIW